MANDRSPIDCFSTSDFLEMHDLRRVWGIVRKGFKIALAQCQRVYPLANYRHLVILALTIAII